MKKAILTAGVAAFLLSLTGVSHADTLMGKVKDINTAGNSLTIVSESSTSTTPDEHKLVWEDSMAQSQALENAKVGDTVTVDAVQNPVTRNWDVKSVRGPLAAVEKELLRTDERMLSGEVRNIDRGARSLILSSKDTDPSSGAPIEYHVVWDASNPNVSHELDEAKVGDKISVMADQNVITKNWKAISIAGPIKAMALGDIQTLTGEVKQVEPEKNFLVLKTTDPASGKEVERRIVWDKDFKDQAKLENARIGERLSVRADQNMVTRNWNVKAIG